MLNSIATIQEQKMGDLWEPGVVCMHVEKTSRGPVPTAPEAMGGAPCERGRLGEAFVVVAFLPKQSLGAPQRALYFTFT